MTKIWKIKSINKRVFYLEQEYRNLIRHIAYKTRSKFPSVPLEMEDIYNLILYKAAQEVAFFNEEKNVNFSAFLAITLRNEAMNQMRLFLSRKHKIMNFYVPMHPNTLMLSDSIRLTPINLADILTNEEIKILTDFYLHGINKRIIYEKYNTNLHNFKKIQTNAKKRIAQKM